MDIESRKKELIDIISRIENEALIKKLEKAIRNLERDQMALNGLLKPAKEKLSIDEMRKEQGFRGIDRNKFEQLATEINIQEDVDKLLADI